MEKEDFLLLLKKYREGRASSEEIHFLHSYYQLLGSGEDLMKDLSPAERDHLKSEIKNRIKRQMDVSDRAAEKSRPSRIFHIRRIAAAIAILITFSAGIYFYVHRPDAGRISGNEVPKNDIAPGGNKARLVLADGRAIVLGEVSNGILTSQGMTKISKSKDGELVYNSSASSGGRSTSEPTGFNTISTPQGGQYTIVLSDGTKVWLNSASSLKFPVAFTGAERVVELAGEAYFEVAKNPSMPFKLKTRNIAVEVLGTHFNVNAYKDEDVIKTTLLEGSVLVNVTGNKQLLRPGQQARVGKGNDISVAKVNTEEIVAWKNGYFMFNNESLESIMRKISKWYNVEVEYKGDPGNLYFGGMVSRSKNISAVLKIMELTGNVHFKIVPGDPFRGKKRRILVMF